jgi:predicted SnoaL-like aldol condensation-catalyzing enzyme
LTRNKARITDHDGNDMITSNKAIVLEVLKRAFVDRDPTVVKQYFGAHYKQHNPVIPDAHQQLLR